MEFLLYSKGTAATLSERKVSLWFNLVAFNGKCWQSFGNIIYFISMDEDDVYFFATELDRGIETIEDIVDSIEKNPIPYFMLVEASEIPYLMMRDEMVRYFQSTEEFKDFDIELFRNEFDIEQNREVYRLNSKSLGGPPHFAMMYYDAENKIILRSSMTFKGYEYLLENTRNKGYQLTEDLTFCLSLPMLPVFEKILNRKIVYDEYEILFER